MSFACRIRCCKKLTFYDILLGCATILVRSVFKGTIARLAKNRIEFIWRDKTWLQVKLNPFDVIHLNFYSRLERRRRRQPQTSIKVHWIQRLGRMKLIPIHFFPARQTIDVKRRNEVLNCNERVDGWQWQGTREWLKPHRKMVTVFYFLLLHRLTNWHLNYCHPCVHGFIRYCLFAHFCNDIMCLMCWYTSSWSYELCCAQRKQRLLL